MKYKKSIERSNFMKRNKLNNVKTHVNDKTDAETDAESWFLWSVFIVTMVLAIYSIYSILHNSGIISI